MMFLKNLIYVALCLNVLFAIAQCNASVETCTETKYYGQSDVKLEDVEKTEIKQKGPNTITAKKSKKTETSTETPKAESSETDTELETQEENGDLLFLNRELKYAPEEEIYHDAQYAQKIEEMRDQINDENLLRDGNWKEQMSQSSNENVKSEDIDVDDAAQILIDLNVEDKDDEEVKEDGILEDIDIWTIEQPKVDEEDWEWKEESDVKADDVEEDQDEFEDTELIGKEQEDEWTIDSEEDVKNSYEDAEDIEDIEDAENIDIWSVSEKSPFDDIKEDEEEEDIDIFAGKTTQEEAEDEFEKETEDIWTETAQNGKENEDIWTEKAENGEDVEDIWTENTTNEKVVDQDDQETEEDAEDIWTQKDLTTESVEEFEYEENDYESPFDGFAEQYTKEVHGHDMNDLIYA